MLLASSFAFADKVSVIACSGDVRVDEALCSPGMKVEEGSRIVTGSGSYADIAFDNAKRNVVNVKENTEVVMLLSGDNKIELVSGEVFASLKSLGKSTSFIVKTPSASCGARGTGWITKATAKATDVSVADGKVFVRGVKKDGTPMDKTFWVGKGFERKVEKFKEPGKKMKMSREKFNRLRNNFKTPFTGKRTQKSKPEDKPKRPEAKPALTRREAGFPPERKMADKFEKKPIVNDRITSKQRQSQLQRKREAVIQRKERSRIIDEQKRIEDLRETTSDDDNVVIRNRLVAD